MEFIGKFHPLLIHLPIGFLIAGFGLEWLYRKNNNDTSNKVIQFLLGFGAITAIISALIGYMLSLSGGYERTLLNFHQWSGFGVAAFASALYFVRKQTNNPNVIWSGWGINLLLVTIAGHYGGSLTHGKDYLVESAPPFIKNIFQSEAAPIKDIPLDSAVVFEDIIQPIMQRKCWTCHNNGKTLGSLNMESLKGWEKGGKTGPLYVAGAPEESLMLQRIFMPISEKEHMPPAGKPQLLPYEVALLEWWIEQKGTFENKVAELERQKRIDQILRTEFGIRDVYAQINARPLNQKQLNQLMEAGIDIYPIAQNSPLLEVSFTRDTAIQTEQLDLLKKARKQIVRLDFSNSSINDDQLNIIAQFPHLIFLALQNTAITDQGLTYLNDMEYLQYLNLYNTQVSDEGLSQISDIPNLKKVFLWQTKATDEAVEELRNAKPGLEVDFGIELDTMYQSIALSPPTIDVDKSFFTDSLKVALKLNFGDVDIRYTLDGTDPDSTSTVYQKPLKIKATTIIKAIALKEGWEDSAIAEEHLFRIRYQPKSAQFAKKPAPQYSADGAKSLIDQKKGSNEFQDGNWLGWEKNHMVATIDMGDEKEVSRVTLGALEAAGSYIFYPKGMKVWVAKEDKNFKKVKDVSYPVADKQNPPSIKSFSETFPKQKARYVKVMAESNLVNPKWHPAPGAPCWLFIDEVIVE